MQTANHLVAGFNIPETTVKNIFADPFILKGVQLESFKLRVNYAGPWTYVQLRIKPNFSILSLNAGPATFHGSDQLISLLRESLPANARHP